MKNLPHLIIVAGPTSTGKSDYAVALAKKCNGEIISADSRQVYRGLDLLSGKITKKEMRGIPHHLLDVAIPKKIFSVTEYERLALRAINDIIQRGKTPILCGGTGFYIDAILYDQQLPEVPPNTKLRKEFSKKSAPELFALLETLDPARAETIDRHNSVRLIRALEIAHALGTVPKISRTRRFIPEWHIIDRPDTELKERISLRLKKRLRAGMLAEAQRLHESGVSYKRMEALGLECRTLARFLQKKIMKQEMITELERDIWYYVKRQRTWFKKYAK